MSMEAKFWANVDKRTADECWEWTSTKWKGYGKARFGDQTGQAHRVAYQLLIGLIPEGLEIDHLCRNRGCVNPAHMECVTHAENVRRSAPATKTHCINGHEFTPENTRIRSRGGRRACRECNREYGRIWRAARSSVPALNGDAQRVGPVPSEKTGPL